ncbi:MAG: glycosyltransferase [Bacteroidia bacterium]
MKSNKPGVLYFLCTDNNQPAGGRQIIYGLVDILNANNVKSFALHQSKGFKYTWFKNETSVAYTTQFKTRKYAKKGLLGKLKILLLAIKEEFQGKDDNKIELSGDDILVIPETRITQLETFKVGVKLVTLAQNVYLSFAGENDFKHISNAYRDNAISLRISMSELGYKTRTFLFPNQLVEHVPIFIDESRFQFHKVKKRIIAYMPQKMESDAKFLLNTLAIRNKCWDYEFVPIVGKTYHQVAQILKETLIFLSFSYREGLGLPPLEAMASGCIVIGYSGNGGNEFFGTKYFNQIEEGDIISYASKVEEIIEEYGSNRQRLDQLREEGSSYVLERYSKTNTEKALIQSFKTIIE